MHHMHHITYAPVLDALLRRLEYEASVNVSISRSRIDPKLEYNSSLQVNLKYRLFINIMNVSLLANCLEQLHFLKCVLHQN